MKQNIAWVPEPLDSNTPCIGAVCLQCSPAKKLPRSLWLPPLSCHQLLPGILLVLIQNYCTTKHFFSNTPKLSCISHMCSWARELKARWLSTIMLKHTAYVPRALPFPSQEHTFLCEAPKGKKHLWNAAKTNLGKHSYVLESRFWASGPKLPPVPALLPKSYLQAVDKK